MTAPGETPILLATTNPHKLDEIKRVIDTPAIAWRLLRDLDAVPDEPIEDQPTFEGNAELKARYYAGHAGFACLADDSGIEVDALGGAPSVISARYSGVDGPRSVVDPANNAKLLEELSGVPIAERGARFVCVLCLVDPDRPGRVVSVRGEVPGRILLPEEADDPGHPERGRGDNGFGYDPLFVLPGGHAFAGLTTAQLTDAQKNAISHRGVASRRLLEAVEFA
ncbi:MAG: non-canonical purine NTP pyrophosphatase [Planctomycetota bacterium]